jgi:glycosyltransferase involved in cell wall biosynthesis
MVSTERTFHHRRTPLPEAILASALHHETAIMIEGHDIICFSNDWDSDPLSKKHIMQRLARRNRVLWVNSVGIRNPTASVYDFTRVLKKLSDFTRGSQRVGEGIHVFSPLVVPFHGSAAARWVNRKALRWSLRRACRKLGFRNPITYTFFPSSADVAGSLGERALIYHCVDEYSEFTGTAKTAILDMERRLMEKCDCVIVSSDLLYTNKKPYNKHTFLVTHGVDVAHFRKACAGDTPVADEMKAFAGPVIGFFGLIADWVDLPLIRSLAISRPEWNFVLIGKAATDVRLLEGLRNVHLLGQKPYALLPSYAKRFDVAILPFVTNELTLAANPLKLREYLAAGLPLVSSALPEAEKLKHALHTGRTPEEFLGHIQRILDSGRTGPQASISRTMDSETWDEKVEQVSRILASVQAGAAAA